MPTAPEATPVPPLPPAVPGDRREFDSPAGRLAYYHLQPAGAGASARPLLLVHSVNAAASAAEVRPLHERYGQSRPVYSLDLPGFGASERSERLYSPRLMTDAIHALVERLRAAHAGQPVDALAVSLGCEFLARAASERPADYHSLALVSPTGLRGAKPRLGVPGSVIGSTRAHRILAWRGWRRGLFGLLTRPGVIRYFLRRTWGGPNIDERLAEYDWLTARQPGAEHAPLCFLSALLFSADAVRLYDALRMPVWMTHGVRGDFTDYRQAERYRASTNWRIDTLPTGALPYFEVPDVFFATLDAHLDGRLVPAAPSP